MRWAGVDMHSCAKLTYLAQVGGPLRFLMEQLQVGSGREHDAWMVVLSQALPL